MSTKVIHIVGASGSGTTTLGKMISQQLGYAHYDSDDYLWLPTDPPFTEKRKIVDRQKLILDDINKTEKCVITGSLCGWGDILIPKFDLVLFLKTPTEVRITRLHEREAKKFGNRIQQGGDMFQIHTDFINWAKTYDTASIDSRSNALHKQWFKKIACPIIELDGTRSPEQNLKIIKDYL